VLAVARLLHSRKIKVTAAQLAQAARGSGQHAKQLQLSPDDRVKLSSHVRSLPLLPHRVELGKIIIIIQDSDVLIANMLLNNFLDKSYSSNAYKVQVYVKPGTLSRRLDGGQKFFIHLLLPERVTRNNHRAREGGSAGGKRTNADIDIAEDHSGEDGEEEGRVGRLGKAPESSSAKRRRSSYHQNHTSSSWVPAAAPDMHFDSDVGANADEDGGSEPESEDMEWKGNLRGAPAVTHRTLRGKSSAQSKAGGAPRSSGASDANALPVYGDEVIDISSE
jgi:hypothetical protein